MEAITGRVGWRWELEEWVRTVAGIVSDSEPGQSKSRLAYRGRLERETETRSTSGLVVFALMVLTV